MEAENLKAELTRLIGQALEGGDYDVDDVTRRLLSGSQFDEAGVDSLDLTAFVLHLQDSFKISVPQEDYGGLVTLEAVEAYVRTHTNLTVDDTMRER